ncbi:uncharacterized protein LOC122091892 [Macadamia integrifolia]|uniref:uncharacterized protein LOC122091892 n=1 Tax=Macadamia integrifolia TaxID=60698 RepID=UPI001C4EF124|nr:uncharacterized protein LOC122091892 [Macadamia integrifolia]XP_042518063.1 uncharacterized protein LOC122091892 [Macadamia integrifolia]
MGFSSVFRSLQEVFPQVDIRVLKAVAIEHPKDADAAVECILFEVLPYLRSPSEPLCTQNDSQDVNHSIFGGEEPGQGVVEGVIADSQSNSVFDASENANDSINTTNALFGDAKCVNEEFVGSSVSSPHGGYGDELQMSACGLGNTALDQPSVHLFLNTETEEFISFGKSQNISVADGSDQVSHVGPGPLIQEDCFTDCCNDASSFNIKDSNELVIHDSWSTCGESHQDQTCLDADSLKVENLPASVQLISSAKESQEETADSAEYESLSAKIGAIINDFEKPDSRSPSENVSAEEVFDAVGHVENGSSSIAIVSHSSQICSIDLLEESIGEAKNNKRTLFLAMESVINKMKELEFQEEAAEKAKREVAEGGLDILAKVEDLREMLQHAKEANDMHAGEVYGEKAILATELRELQARIQNLSDEREKSLAVLDEMSQTLEIRLSAAAEERKIAGQEKLENEKSARMVLVEQELAMERVVEETKRLQQQAEENSKLRDFLMDRGHVVDILQGEIAVICQDVKLLKEKFDECVPISKSLSSSQTSCILASSSSSIKSLVSDRVPEEVEASEEKPSPAPSSEGQVQKSSVEENTAAGDDKIPLDDGWEFFGDEDDF